MTIESGWSRANESEEAERVGKGGAAGSAVRTVAFAGPAARSVEGGAGTAGVDDLLPHRAGYVPHPSYRLGQ